MSKIILVLLKCCFCNQRPSIQGTTLVLMVFGCNTINYYNRFVWQQKITLGIDGKIYLENIKRHSKNYNFTVFCRQPISVGAFLFKFYYFQCSKSVNITYCIVTVLFFLTRNKFKKGKFTEVREKWILICGIRPWMTNERYKFSH